MSYLGPSPSSSRSRARRGVRTTSTLALAQATRIIFLRRSRRRREWPASIIAQLLFLANERTLQGRHPPVRGLAGRRARPAWASSSTRWEVIRPDVCTCIIGRRPRPMTGFSHRDRLCGAKQTSGAALRNARQSDAPAAHRRRAPSCQATDPRDRGPRDAPGDPRPPLPVNAACAYADATRQAIDPHRPRPRPATSGSSYRSGEWSRLWPGSTRC